MELKFITQVIKITSALSLVSLLAVTLFLGYMDGLAFFAGAVWGCINLILIKNLVQKVLPFDSKNAFKILLILGVKFPLLYLVGALLLTVAHLPPISLMAGFSLVFAVIFLNFIRCFMQKKIAVFLFALTSVGSLHASLENKTPELPNLFTFIEHIFADSPFAAFLHEWSTIVFSLVISIGLSLMFYFGTRKSTLIPGPFQNFLEWMIENLRKFILEVLGPQGEKYVPFLGTLFLFILSMNWLVLIPLMKPPSSNINVTAALAICVFCLVQYLNIKNMGFFGFIYHMAGSPKDTIGWMMVPLMFPVEVLTQFTRPVTLALRLFGNVIGEDILIGVFALFGVLMLSFISWPVGFPLQIPFMFFALLTGLMQALVFTILSTIYILLSIPSEEHESFV